MKQETHPNALSRLEVRLRPRLAALYGPQADQAMSRILQVCTHYTDLCDGSSRPAWNESDTVLITYADQVRSDEEHPLAALRRFLDAAGLRGLLRVLHLLPFFPASSDDGFSVIDYRQVDPDYGTWADIAELGQDFDLMFDLVLNHASRHSAWFNNYLQGVEPQTRFFVEADPADDLSCVVRPRTSPLLTPFETSRGLRHVWTTFSEDQVDLNYGEPAVLAEMLDVLLSYVRHGARILRLDAVAFLWKQLGTSCIHLPQTHAIVQLLRDVVQTLAPSTLLLTETNVPHRENISYWGDADEAQLVYNFALPPLVLDALLTGDGTFLHRWLAELPAPLPGTTFLNFTASHDGIGVRPLESLVPEARAARLVAAVEARGGMVSRRMGPRGVELPYELNITYFDALGEPGAPRSELQVRRFLASQALLLSLRGIPAVYFHSLLATANDHAGVARTGRARSINRRKFTWAELLSLLQPRSLARQVLDNYRRLLALRIEQPAFHPDAAQEILDLGDPALVAFLRVSPTCDQKILVAANVSGQARRVDVCRHALAASGDELISGAPCDQWDAAARLAPYEVIWLPVQATRSRPITTQRGYTDGRLLPEWTDYHAARPALD